MNRPRPPQNPADDEPAVLHRRIAELEAALEAQAAELSQAQQLASRAYQEHTERIARLAASVPGMLYQVVLAPDQSFTFTYVSDGCRELYELEPTDLLQNPQLLIDAITPEAREQMQDSLKARWSSSPPGLGRARFRLPAVHISGCKGVRARPGAPMAPRFGMA
jgi:PAS domain-containing protein